MAWGFSLNHKKEELEQKFTVGLLCIRHISMIAFKYKYIVSVHGASK